MKWERLCPTHDTSNYTDSWRHDTRSHCHAQCSTLVQEINNAAVKNKTSKLTHPLRERDRERSRKTFTHWTQTACSFFIWQRGVIGGFVSRVTQKLVNGFLGNFAGRQNLGQGFGVRSGSDSTISKDRQNQQVCFFFTIVFTVAKKKKKKI